MINLGSSQGYAGIIGYLPTSVADGVKLLPDSKKNFLEELRLRIDRPVRVVFPSGTSPVFDGDGNEIVLKGEDIRRTVYRMTEGSVYALEEEFRRGYVTIPGGHRVGISGRVVLDGGKVKGIRDIFSLNFRVAREIKGCGSSLLPKLMDKGKPLNTLIFSPPRGGKTTLLRDLTRLLSSGSGDTVLNVALIDQRSEIAGSFLGQPQLDVGPSTDVLDGAPKAEGMMMAIRSLGPQVVVTDEIGDMEEKTAIIEAVNSGIALILSAHGSSYEDICRRPLLKELMSMGVFNRLVELGNTGSNRVKAVYDGRGVAL
ncbi:MAG: stage III sporulation protein AA [Bacillota bacterium]|nr:stage III sporulation protein AA [Bacillota bacterium]